MSFFHNTVHSQACIEFDQMKASHMRLWHADTQSKRGGPLTNQAHWYPRRQSSILRGLDSIRDRGAHPCTTAQCLTQITPQPIFFDNNIDQALVFPYQGSNMIHRGQGTKWCTVWFPLQIKSHITH
uniref:Uncharacterized protein n=1 Tax=Anguilla anguilla TaxID=7936 RepID=A0A0E9XKD6_ANGAN